MKGEEAGRILPWDPQDLVPPPPSSNDLNSEVAVVIRDGGVAAKHTAEVLNAEHGRRRWLENPSFLSPHMRHHSISGRGLMPDKVSPAPSIHSQARTMRPTWVAARGRPRRFVIPDIAMIWLI